MFIGELIKRKYSTKNRIIELYDYLYKMANNSNNSGNVYGEAFSMLFDLLDKYQNCVIVIENSNIDNKVTIGSNEITVSNAIKIKKNLNEKIKCLEAVINGSDFSINVIDLMSQRDHFLDEYSIIDEAITASDWHTEVK